MAGNVNTGDRDDPNNYVSFDSFLESAPKIYTMKDLAARWTATHPDDPVLPQGVSAAPNASPLTPDPPPEATGGCAVTRVFAALQLVGGGLELVLSGGALLAPEPTGLTKVIGVVGLVHGTDTMQSAVRTIATCNRAATFTQLGASAAAEGLGASPPTAEKIGIVTDITVGFGTTFGIGTLSKVAPAAGRQLVHLTTAESAAAIRGSQTLGLGKSTVYAGSETLATAKGWSILARTGLRPAQATEVILLPSAANKSFLVVSPIGPFSGWQRISGTVFSAGTGSFNLSTGVFTRSGPAVNQLVVYGTDAAIMASVRAAGEVCQ